MVKQDERYHAGIEKIRVESASRLKIRFICLEVLSGKVIKGVSAMSISGKSQSLI